MAQGEQPRKLSLYDFCAVYVSKNSLLNIGVVYELDALRGGGLPGIHDRLAINVAHDGREAAYVVRKRLVETHGGLYLVEIDLAPVLDKEIDLEALVIAHEVHIRLKATIKPRLEDVRNHHVLEKPAESRIAVHLLRVPDAEEVAAQPDVREVHLGSLDKPLSEVAVVAR